MKKRFKYLSLFIFTIVIIITFLILGIVFLSEKEYPLGILFLILPFVIIGVGSFVGIKQSKK